MKHKIKAGTASFIMDVRLQDSTSTVGAGINVAYNAAGLTVKWKRKGDSAFTTMSLVTATAGTWTSSGFCQATNAPTGHHELHLTNAMIAAAAVGVVGEIYGAANLLPCPFEIELDKVGYQDDAIAADAVAINGSTVAATALSSQYNGTGLHGDTYPARQDQIALRRQMTKASGTTFETSTDFFNGISIVGKTARVQATSGGTAYPTRIVSSAYVGGTDTTTVTVADTIAGANGASWYLWIEPRPGNAVDSSGRVTALDSNGAVFDFAAFIAKFTGITVLTDWLKAMIRKSEPDATALSEINTGGGTYDATTDSLEANADAVATITSGLSGPSSVTLTFKDASNVVVPNVEFTVVGQGSARASALGVKAFGLNDGTYTVVASPVGTTLFANYTLVVSGTTTATITGTTTTVSVPSDPTKCVVNGYTRDAKGDIVASKEVEFKLIRTDDTTGTIVHDNTVTVTSGVDGYFEIELPQGWIYQVRPVGAGKSQKLLVSDDASQAVTVVIA